MQHSARPADGCGRQGHAHRDGGDRRRRFVIDFQGDIFADVEKIKGVGPNIAVNPGKISDIAFTLDTSRRIGRLPSCSIPKAKTYSEM